VPIVRRRDGALFKEELAMQQETVSVEAYTHGYYCCAPDRSKR